MFTLSFKFGVFFDIFNEKIILQFSSTFNTVRDIRLVTVVVTDSRTNGSRTTGHQDLGSQTNGSRTKGHQDKWALGQMGSGQMGCGQLCTRTNGSRTIASLVSLSQWALFRYMPCCCRSCCRPVCPDKNCVT